MKNAVENVYDVAQWFLHTEPMTHKKLQKLLYFSYGIYLAQNNDNPDDLTDSLFENRFEAWVHGPVDPAIYALYKNNGINLLFLENIEIVSFNQNVMNALNKTMEIYGNYSADELENISHNQAPWINAREGLTPIEPSTKLLSDVDIFLTFRNILLNGQI